MVKPLNYYQQSTANWRGVLQKNNRSTRIVIACFILIYLCLGLFIDLYFQSSSYHPDLKLLTITKYLVTGKIIPYATIICCSIAVISLWVTFSFHNKLMLLGTNYIAVNAKSTEPQQRQLFNITEEMRLAAGLSYTPKVFIIEADYMNAFASGYSEKSAMIAVTKGLLKKLNREELTAVVAHELSHIRHGDIKLTLMASVLSNLLLIMIDVLFYSFLFGGDTNSRRRNNDNEGRGVNYFFIIIIILRYLLPLITVLLTLFLSRSREYMADAGCVELMRDNEPLASALMKIANDTTQNQGTYQADYQKTAHENLRRQAYIFDPAQAGLKPSASVSSILSTHPSLEKRLAALGFKKNNAIESDESNDEQ